MTNLINILKHCPEGTKLYSPIYGEVTFTRISIINTILVKATKSNGEITSVDFNRFGRFSGEFSNSECVLFPSKDQRDWDKFRIPAKKGDIMMFDDKSAVFMIDAMTDNYVTIIAYVDKYSTFRTGGQMLLNYIPASKDMKKKFFDAMDKAGYTWDGETLRKKQKSQFKPFEKVLVRDSESDKWRCAFYSHYEPNGIYHYGTIIGMYAMCIPFEGNEHLVGTTKNP